VNPALRLSAAHVFVSSLESPALSDDDDHHLRRVLRIGPRDQLTISDGLGAWANALLSEAAGLQRTGEIVHEPAAAPTCVACAIAKGDRPEWVVQKLTELGIGQIVLFEAVRSVVRWDASKRERQLVRLRKVALEASMQSRRVRLPEVSVLSWREVLQLPGLAVAEPGSPGVINDSVRSVVIGPEGGFDPSELDHHLATVGLSEQVLRVETAAIVAAVQLAATRH